MKSAICPIAARKSAVLRWGNAPFCGSRSLAREYTPRNQKDLAPIIGIIGRNDLQPRHFADIVRLSRSVRELPQCTTRLATRSQSARQARLYPPPTNPNTSAKQVPNFRLAMPRCFTTELQDSVLGARVPDIESCNLTSHAVIGTGSTLPASPELCYNDPMRVATRPAQTPYKGVPQ